MGVSVGRLHLEDSLLHLKDRNIEGSSSEIVNGDNGRLGSLKTVGKGGGGRLVNDSKDLKTGDGSGVLSSLSLGVIEVGGDGDD